MTLLPVQLPLADDYQPAVVTFLQLTSPLASAEPAPAAPAPPEPDPGTGQLQIGEFVLGDADCPSLTGHPNIRY